MNQKKYSLGLDFGTLSARAIIVDTKDGAPLGKDSIFTYPHAIITELNGKVLPSFYAIQHPKDYIDALEFLLRDVTEKNGIDKEDIVGIGIDFTDCTFFPIDEDFTPLCFIDKYKNQPHAYAKLWKHHAKEEYAQKIHDAAISYDIDILSVTGNKMTSEFMIPKLYEIFCEAPEIYKSAYKFISAGDYIASLLIGKKLIHSKAFSAKQHFIDEKYPDKAFFESIDKDFANVYEEKICTKLSSPEEKIGTLCHEWTKKTGLSEKTAIAAPIIDANGAIPASGIKDGTVITVMGTSATVEIITPSKNIVNHALTNSYGAICKNMNVVESALSAMGDLFDWFVKNCVPERYFDEAKKKNLNIHQYLRSLAEKQKIGQHGLIALDWWNGSRYITLNNDLSGVIIGLRLSTAPEDIYRALIESTVFAIRRIFDSFREQKIKISEIFATGGIALKDPMLMQILADVLDMPINCLDSTQATAIGSAIIGAVAAECYKTVRDASDAMRCPIAKTYYPSEVSHEEYEKIYEKYKKLCRYFTNEGAEIMEFLSHNRK